MMTASTPKKEPIYRILFIQHDKQYELYSRYLSEESLMGFIEVEELIFQEIKPGVVINPTDEKLRAEFKNVKRAYIPMHAILRIDEMSQEGVATVTDEKVVMMSNVSRLHFPTLIEE